MNLYNDGENTHLRLTNLEISDSLAIIGYWERSQIDNYPLIFKINIIRAMIKFKYNKCFWFGC